MLHRVLFAQADQHGVQRVDAGADRNPEEQDHSARDHAEQATADLVFTPVAHHSPGMLRTSTHRSEQATSIHQQMRRGKCSAAGAAARVEYPRTTTLGMNRPRLKKQ